MTVTSSSLTSGASIAAGTSLVIPPTITRADLIPIKSTTKSIEGTPGITGHRFPSEIGKYYMQIIINEYDRKAFESMTSGGFGAGVKGGSTLNPTDTIILPLPQNIVDNNTTSFNEESMGDAVGGAVDALSGLIRGNRQNTNYLRKLAGGLTQNVAKVGMAAAGVASNKFMTIVLQGPQYKEHSFTWKLYPKSEKESRDLNIIINLLKKSMRTKLTGENFFFAFPKVFKLCFKPQGNGALEIPENYLFEFKPAVMKSISVNYTPSGSPNFYGKTGAPDGITLTMNFVELEYWLSEDAQSIFGGDYSSGSSLQEQLRRGEITQEELDQQAAQTLTGAGVAPNTPTP